MVLEDNARLDFRHKIWAKFSRNPKVGRNLHVLLELRTNSAENAKVGSDLGNYSQKRAYVGQKHTSMAESCQMLQHRQTRVRLVPKNTPELTQIWLNPGQLCPKSVDVGRKYPMSVETDQILADIRPSSACVLGRNSTFDRNGHKHMSAKIASARLRNSK